MMQVRDHGWSGRSPLVQHCDPFTLKLVFYYVSINELLISIKCFVFFLLS